MLYNLTFVDKIVLIGALGGFFGSLFSSIIDRLFLQTQVDQKDINYIRFIGDAVLASTGVGLTTGAMEFAVATIDFNPIETDNLLDTFSFFFIVITSTTWIDLVKLAFYNVVASEKSN